MKPIILNENYRIEKDSYSWVLIFNEEREKLNKKTNEKEQFTFEEKWYYPDLKQLLVKVIDLELKSAINVEEMLAKLDELHSFVSSLKNTIFNPKN